MADYNIQMKQFNGSDYDNLYPATLASLVRYDPSSSLESTTIQDALTELDVKRPYIIKGSYVGNGNSGTASPNTLTFNRDIVLLLIVDSVSSASSNFDQNTRMIFMGQTKDGQRTYSYLNKTLRWFGSSAESQLNASGHTYLYVAIAEEAYAPYVGQTWVLTKDTTFIVPITGNYKLELHGGGGGGGAGYATSVYSGYYGGAGGGSGQMYNNIQLTSNQVIDVVIGVGGNGGSSSGQNGNRGGTTYFGTYSIDGGNGGIGATDRHHGTGGTASGNIASNGEDSDQGYLGVGGSGGSTFGDYGSGGLAGATTSATANYNKGKNGAVILTYLGG